MDSPELKAVNTLDHVFLTVVSVVSKDQRGDLVEHVRSRFTDSPDAVVGQLFRELGDSKSPLELNGRLVVWSTPLSQLAEVITKALPKPALEQFVNRLNTRED